MIPGIFLFVGLVAGCFILPWSKKRVQGLSMGETRAVSVIIPARNEEENLPALLTSLKSSHINAVDVIVVDDNSTDRTVEVAQRFEARVITSGILPKGWTGKAWACSQGARAARHDLLVFLDADTFFQDGGFKKALDIHADGGLQPLSFLPWHKTGSFIEDLSLFFNLMMVLGTVGKGKLCGQSLFIKRKDYEKSGGHESVRGEILENLFLARRLSDLGYTPWCLLGKNMISMRMYRSNIHHLVEGWAKAFARGTKQVPFSRMLTSIFWIAGLFASFLGLILSLILHRPENTLFESAYVLYSLQLLWLSSRVGGFRVFTSLFYPLPLIFFQWVFVKSALIQKNRTGATWKGRDVPAS